MKKGIVVALAAVGVAALAAPAGAAMTLGYQELGPAGPVTGSGTVNAFTGSQSAFYGDTFGSPTSPITASPGAAWGFYDDFLFSVGTTTAADSVTSTINLGNLSINNLEVRLYSAAGNSPLPVLGVPNGTVWSSWNTPISGPGFTGSYSVLNTDLKSGTYVLEVRGNVTGAAGGSYSGTLNVQPVPLPAAFPLLLSGVGFLGGLARRRRAGVAAS
jgi:hypothetical protein